MTEIKTAQAWGEMSDQTISPCPVCGTVPPIGRFLNLHAIITGCKHIDGRHQTVEEWESACNEYLGRAMRDLGIETVEQLKGRLAPDKDYTFLLSIIHWAITFWDAVPNDTVMHYTPLPKGIDLDYLRDLVKGVKYPPKLADDSPVAPDPRVAVLEAERDAAITMLAKWIDGVDRNGSNWDGWDHYYKTAKYSGTPIRELIDAKLKQIAAQRGGGIEMKPANKNNPRRVIQIAAVPCGHDNSYHDSSAMLYALCDDNTIWSIPQDLQGEWKQLPPIPQTEE